MKATKDTYNQPERRQIQQIPFKTREAAQKAKAELTSGKSFLDIAKTNEVEESDLNIGLLQKSEMVDPNIAETAFKLKKDEVSPIVKGKFTYALVRVTDIKPAVTRTLDDVKDIIRSNLQTRKASAEAQKAHDLVDELRLTGKSLKEIAAETKLKFIDIPAIDKAGKKPDGKDATELADLPQLLTTAFQSEVGLENEPLQTSDGGYLWFDVLEITEKKQKPFADVKAEADRLWRENELQKAITKLAGELVKKANNGDPMAALTKLAGGKLQTSQPIRRDEQGGGLTQRAITRAFSLATGKTASVPTDDGRTRIVFRIAKVVPPKPATPTEKSAISEALVGGIRTDAIVSYVAALQKRHPVNINQKAFNQLTGRATPTQP